MRAHEIIQDYIDPRKISDETYAEIVDALDRIGATPASPRFIQLMYADERDELELGQLRLDLKRTQAEVGNLEAEAARDRAATRRELATVEDDEGLGIRDRVPSRNSSKDCRGTSSAENGGPSKISSKAHPAIGYAHNLKFQP